MKYTASKYGEFYYFNNDDIGRRIAAGEFHDEHLRPFIDQLKIDDTMIDVGANIGFHSIYAAKRGARVLAFEAAEALYEVLVANITNNGVDRKVHPIFKAVFSEVKWLTLNPAWQHQKDPHGIPDWEVLPNTGGFSLVPIAKDETTTPPWRWMSTTLDCMLYDRLKLIKVDTQGADLQVLKGAVKTLVQHRPVVCFEFEPQDGDKNACGDRIEDFLEFFEILNYGVRRIHQGMTAADYVAEPAFL